MSAGQDDDLVDLGIDGLSAGSFLEIQIIGNGNPSTPDFRQGFGFSSVRVEVRNAGAVVWSGSGSGFGGTFNPGGVEGNEVRLYLYRPRGSQVWRV